MTPEQETRIRKILGDWPEHNTWAEIDQVFTLLKVEIENMEWKAYGLGYLARTNRPPDVMGGG